MPTHLHTIVALEGSPLPLSEIIRRFKSRTTVETNKAARQAGQLQRLWQPNYYEHVIRSERALTKIREYIANNPLAEKLRWEEFEK